MECDRIKKRLSEYVDGVLDAKAVTILKEHLKTCGECNKEYAEYISLKSLVSEIGSMEPQKAPEDFLQNLHKRIGSGSLFKDLREILFFPARIKIPMELAALAAISLLVFTVFNMVTPEKQVILESPGIHKTEVTIKPEIIAEGITDGVPIQLALLLEADQTSSPISSENVLLVNSGNGAGAMDMSGFGFTTEQAQKRDLVDVLISDIYEMISLEEGKLLVKEYRNGTDYPEYLTFELPGTNYGPFLKRIENIGTLRTPAPTLPKDYKKLISLRMQIVTLE